MTVKKLHEKKKCHPYLLGRELDKQVKAYLSSLQDRGAVVNTTIIAISCAKGIVKNKDSNLLASNGGHIVLSKYWKRTYSSE